MKTDNGYKPQPTDYCSRCGKLLMNIRTGLKLTGVVCMFPPEEEIPEADRPFFKKQLGRYYGGVQYAFCTECFLATLHGRNR